MDNVTRIEVYGTCLFDARSAEEGGADGFQLGGTVEGGSTPSLGLIRIVRKAVDIRLNVVIRPIGEGRGVPSARCTAQEIEAMQYDVRLCREEGVDGIVLGIRDEAGGMDVEAMQAVLAEAGDLHQVTLSQVFDGSLAAMEQAKTLGVDRVYWDGLRWDGRIGLPEEVERLDEHARRLVEAGGDQVAILADLNMPLEVVSGTLERIPLREIYVYKLVYDDHPFEGNRTVDPRKVKLLRDVVDRARA